MTAHELFDRLSNWNSLYDTNLQSEIPETLQECWDKGMLNNASELYVVEELNETEAGKNLQEAIYFAKTHDCTKLPVIRGLLGNVQTYMYKNGLT